MIDRSLACIFLSPIRVDFGRSGGTYIPALMIIPRERSEASDSGKPRKDFQCGSGNKTFGAVWISGISTYRA